VLADLLLALEHGAFAHAERHVDGIDLGDRREHALVGAHHVAHVHVHAPDATAHGRPDLRVAEIQLGLAQGSLVGRDGGGRLVCGADHFVEPILRRRVAFEQPLRARQLLQRAVQAGLAAGHLGPGSLELCRVTLALDGEEQLPLGHVLAFAELALLEHALDARAQVHVAIRLGLAHEVEGLVDGDAADGDDAHRRGRRGLGRRLFAAGERYEQGERECPGGPHAHGGRLLGEPTGSNVRSS
jgi:hypothetical protein